MHKGKDTSDKWAIVAVLPVRQAMPRFLLIVAFGIVHSSIKRSETAPPRLPSGPLNIIKGSPAFLALSLPPSI